ncbi:GTD-binding domain [Sesbania bispinosa]|nr:GTD-binding domain [Sesbania bispinosa]
MATRGVSSSKWHNLSTRVTRALASALLEWLLIFFLFIDAVFSYVITKFAGYCKLQTPCLFCSRLDHVLGKEKRGYYWDLICSGHKSEISSLVLCHAHDKLVNIQGMCETCLLSFATKNRSNAEAYQLSVGMFGEESDSRFDQDPLLGEHMIAKRCSCCDEKWVLNGSDQKLVFTKSIGSDAADFDASDVGNDFHEKRRAKQSVSVRAAHLRNNQVDPLSRVGYTELKNTSDTESESEVPLSDDDGISIPVHRTDDAKEDIKVSCELTEPCTVDLNDDLASGKPRTSASVLEPLLSESEKQIENTDIHCTTSAVATTMENGNGLAELDWQQVERSAVCPSPSELLSFNDVPPLSHKTGVPVEVSKENYDMATDEVRLTSKQTPTMDCEEIIKSGNRLITSEAGLEPTSGSSDSGQQNPVLLDLGDAYKLAISNKGRQLSGILAEHWLGKDSTRISEDLRMLLSQFSASRGTDLSVNDISPRLSINSDEVKTSDVSNSAGMQILQKMVSLERNESGLSLDGSIVSEIEGEGPVDRLKRQVDHDRKLLSALYKELEEERNASAVAAHQALAMITRLQEEKATLHMEALQYLRMMDEESEYETEALQKANDLVAEKEKEIEDLEAKLEFYRKKFPDESVPENMVETSSEMKVKDIGLDHSQCTCIENDESVIGKSVTENPNISDKSDILLKSLEEKNVQSVKSSPSEFQDEKLYISQRLKKLENQVYFFLNIHQSQDNWLNSENVEKESPECCEKLGNNLLMQDSVSSFKLSSDAIGDNPSSKKPPICNQNGELEYNGHDSPVLCGNNDLSSAGSLVSDFVGRLQVLEEDQSFLEHSINLLSKGDKGLQLLQEIAYHLQQLRRIGIKEIDQPVA